jgi:hypothetical protein
MTTVSDRATTRIPNLPMGRIVDEKGFPTDDELTFRQVLLTNLQRLMGNEGLVIPSLEYADIVRIVNNTETVGTITRYTCAFGTLFYSTGLPDPGPPPTNPNGNKIWVTIEDPANPGVPLLKEVNLI